MTLYQKRLFKIFSITFGIILTLIVVFFIMQSISRIYFSVDKNDNGMNISSDNFASRMKTAFEQSKYCRNRNVKYSWKHDSSDGTYKNYYYSYNNGDTIEIQTNSLTMYVYTKSELLNLIEDEYFINNYNNEYKVSINFEKKGILSKYSVSKIDKIDKVEDKIDDSFYDNYNINYLTEYNDKNIDEKYIEANLFEYFYRELLANEIRNDRGFNYSYDDLKNIKKKYYIDNYNSVSSYDLYNLLYSAYMGEDSLKKWIKDEYIINIDKNMTFDDYVKNVESNNSLTLTKTETLKIGDKVNTKDIKITTSSMPDNSYIKDYMNSIKINKDNIIEFTANYKDTFSGLELTNDYSNCLSLYNIISDVHYKEDKKASTSK